MENRGRRIFAAVLFLVVGVGTLAYWAVNVLGAQSGWQQIDANGSVAESCAGDFVLFYELGAGGVPVSAEKRTLTDTYTEAAKAAYRLFNSNESFDGITNLHDMNLRPNEVLTVPDALYDALSLLVRYNERSIYLGPVYETYNGIFTCQEDWQTEDFDPLVNAGLAAYFARIAAFARDSGSIDLELLGNDQVRLRVSEEYLAFARDNEFDCFLDLGWMKNAFAADLLAQALADQGHTHGALSSSDGYVRCLDGQGNSFSLNLYDWTGAAIRTAVMRYEGPMTLVSLRGYPLSGEEYGFYVRSDGQVRTPYVDIQSGLPTAQGNTLVCSTRETGCAETLLRMRPLFAADAIDTEGLPALAEDGVYALWYRGQTILYNDPALTLENVPEPYTPYFVG